MKLEPIIRKLFLTLFPSITAYMNFVFIWVFLLVMISNTKGNSLIVLVSAIGTIYSYNEWVKSSRVRTRTYGKGVKA